jgi:hypothetical protein
MERIAVVDFTNNYGYHGVNWFVNRRMKLVRSIVKWPSARFADAMGGADYVVK